MAARLGHREDVGPQSCPSGGRGCGRQNTDVPRIPCPGWEGSGKAPALSEGVRGPVNLEDITLAIQLLIS